MALIRQTCASNGGLIGLGEQWRLEPEVILERCEATGGVAKDVLGVFLPREIPIPVMLFVVAINEETFLIQFLDSISQFAHLR